MKKNYLILILGLILLIGYEKALPNEKQQSFLQQRNAKFFDIQNELNNKFHENNPSERRGWKQFKRWEYFWEQRVYPNGEFPNSVEIFKEIENYSKKIDKEQIQNGKTWKSLGPNFPPPAANTREQGVGRVNIIRFHPNDELDLWIGAASGGLWRSTNGGNTWSNFPFFNFLSLGVTDIAISPSNPQIIYVSTGDADGSIGSANNYYSIGVAKSIDGGKTWNITGFAKELADRRILTRILVNPSNPDIVILGANDGIYKTTDGGKVWINKTSEWSVIDMDFKPGDPNTIYASTYSYSGKNYVLKSTDYGETWKTVTLINNSFRTNLEVSPANPDNIYCLSANNSNNGFNEIRISSDGGETWITTADVSSVGNILGWYDGKGTDLKGQGGYDLSLGVSPKDENLMFTGGVNIWKSTDMCQTMTLNTHWFGYYSKPFVHADIHDLKYSPSGKRLYACHDGGISYTANNGADWHDISEGLNITQFYRLSSCDLYSDVIVGGSQDNGTSAILNNEWAHIYSGDGMECLVDPTNPLRLFASLYYGSFYRSNNGGKNFSTSINRDYTKENAGWVTPFVCDPSVPSTLYCGHQNVWQNISNGDASKWKKISNFGSSQVLQSLAVAPSDSKTIYAANLSELFATYDGGTTWTSIYKSSSSGITYIAVDPINPKRIWITKSGYTSNDKVWEFDGEDWKNLSGNLPNIPINTIVYQKNSPDRIYIGTDIGVFYSDYSSGYWEKYGNGLPNVIVLELEINYSSKVMLRAASYGLGIWECEVSDCNLPEPEVKIIGNLEFCEGKSVTLELVGNPENFVWSTGETTKSITVKESGTYSVIITNNDGCKAKSTGIIVKVNPNKDITFTSSLGHFAFCGDESTMELRASLGFDKYKWSTGDTTRKITVTEPGEYYVIGTTSAGCSSQSIIANIQKGNNPDKPIISFNNNEFESTEAFAYQWYKDNKKITDATQRTYKMTEPESGKFMVEVFSEIGCSTFSDPYDLVSASESEVLGNKSLEIFPNPNNGIFSVTFNNILYSKINVEILDITGKIIYSKLLTNNGSNTFEINQESLSSGTYLIRFFVNGQIISEKLIIN